MYLTKIYATCNNFKDFNEFQDIQVYQPIELNELPPNLWISHDWEYRYASVGRRYMYLTIGPASSELGRVWPAVISLSHRARRTDMPHLSVGWIILAKENCSLTVM